MQDAGAARDFLTTHATQWFVDQIPMDRRYWVCLAAIATADGGRVDVAGMGEAADDAVLRCMGEAAEVLSQQAPRGAPEVPEGAVLRGGWWDARAEGAVAAATLIGSGATVAVPAGLLWRGLWPVGPKDPPISEGCAAGPTREEARLSAVLELIERDAVAGWWGSGRPLRLVERALVERQGGAPRQVWTLDLGGGALAPVAGLVSTDAQGGGFVFAAAARPSFAEAAAAAARELAQFEMAQAALRPDPGAVGTDPHGHRARAARRDAEALVGPLDPRAARSVDLPRASPAETLAILAGRAGQNGLRIALADLTRPDLGIPVCKAVSPDLIPSRSPDTPARLEQWRNAFGPPARARDDLLPY